MKKFWSFFTVVKDRDATINIVTLVLAVIGLVMAVSASMTASDNSTRLLIMTSIKQIIYFVISYFFMVFVSKLFNYKYLRKLVMPLSILMTIMLLVPLLFEGVKGAQAWIRFSLPYLSFTIQPSEFAKVLIILLVAMYFGDLRLNTPRSKKAIINPVMYMLLIQVFIVLVLQSDLGSAIVLLVVGVLSALIPSHPKLKNAQNILIILIFVGIGASFFLLSDKGIAFLSKYKFLKSYQLSRFTDYANPFINIAGSGYQLAGSLVAFSRGGLLGVGLGQSVQKYGYLPEANNDFIIALIAEELGFVGVMALLLLYAILIYRLVYFALKVKSEKDKVILMGTVIYIFVHILLNVGGSSGTIPLTGVPLLLVSSGGSSTMAIMLAIGISQNIIARYKRRNA